MRPSTRGRQDRLSFPRSNSSLPLYKKNTTQRSAQARLDMSPLVTLPSNRKATQGYRVIPSSLRYFTFRCTCPAAAAAVPLSCRILLELMRQIASLLLLCIFDSSYRDTRTSDKRFNPDQFNPNHVSPIPAGSYMIKISSQDAPAGNPHDILFNAVACGVPRPQSTAPKRLGKPYTVDAQFAQHDDRPPPPPPATSLPLPGSRLRTTSTTGFSSKPSETGRPASPF